MAFLWMAFVLFGRAAGMEPLAILNSAVQPVWQAGAFLFAREMNSAYDGFAARCAYESEH